MGLLLLGIRINEAVTEMGPITAGRGSELRCGVLALWALAAAQKHALVAQTTPPFSHYSVRLSSQ